MSAPITLPTANSPWPRRAAVTAVTNSGNDVPNATSVAAITLSGTDMRTAASVTPGITI